MAVEDVAIGIVALDKRRTGHERTGAKGHDHDRYDATVGALRQPAAQRVTTACQSVAGGEREPRTCGGWLGGSELRAEPGDAGEAEGQCGGRHHPQKRTAIANAAAERSAVGWRNADCHRINCARMTPVCPL